ncbi:MAG: Acyl-CoA thioesterase [Modestobacter sp.]|nr:Acyl-CoA thioesterase [Modestobacter sp.]MCW2507465.1 Acyl-CoA thioesterase [Modestobacter sp.]MCW2575896.1 Acyl-CoA thioesterase [Modestobacter sp.]MCW2619663.1 Acyl-CoA thioesterase [Modestobacter sp.]
MTPGLQDILDLEQIEVHVFRGRSRPTAATRTFGGEVASQALVAAGRTAPADRPVHSLHAYFLRPGDPGEPILYTVDAIRDGRTFTTRRVVAVQRGEPIFHLSASFAVVEEGFAHQRPQLDAPDPDDLPTAAQTLEHADERSRTWLTRISEAFPLELRFPDELPRFATVRGERRDPHQRLWLRSAQPLDDEPLIHACAATYASDLLLLSSALPPHGVVIDDPGVLLASLDHAVWFHAPFRADEWLLYDQEGTWAGGSRALCRGRFFDRHGTLVASVVQEGLVRVTPRPGSSGTPGSPGE